jgi:hypothetical protein
MPTLSISPVERWVAGSKFRIDSMVSPTKSSRAGWALPAGKMSTLGGGIEVPNRLDGVADEVEPRRLGAAGGKDVDDAAADAELAMRVDGVLPGEAGVDEQRGKRVRIHLGAGPQFDRGGKQSVGPAHSRKQGSGRRHDHAPRAGGRRVQSPGAGREHAGMRREAAVGIDLVRRERKHRLFDGGVGQPLEGREEEPDVARVLFDVRVRRYHHQERRAERAGPGGRRLAVGGGRQEERLRRRRQPSHAGRARRTKPRTADGGFQQRLQSQGGRHGQRAADGGSRTLQRAADHDGSCGLPAGASVDRCQRTVISAAGSCQ